MAFVDYVRLVKVKKAKLLLTTTNRKVYELHRIWDIRVSGILLLSSKLPRGRPLRNIATATREGEGIHRKEDDYRIRWQRRNPQK